jgi:hypothetical protein
MATWTPDPTFYPSPRMATKAPAEKLAYVVHFDPERKRADGLAVVDVDPQSPSYAQIVGQVELAVGDETHHFGWNACSSCLCPNAPHPHLERRYLIADHPVAGPRRRRDRPADRRACPGLVPPRPAEGGIGRPVTFDPDQGHWSSGFQTAWRQSGRRAMAVESGSAQSARRALASWWRAWRHRPPVERSPADPALHALAEAVLARADLASARAAARADMARMMRHFGIEPARVAPPFWARLSTAESTCAQCVSIGRCQRWSYRQPSEDAPRLFCPNAELFDEIASSEGARRQPDRPPND